MLEYLDYRHWVDDEKSAYAAEVLRNDCRLQYCDGCYSLKPTCGGTSKYYPMTGNILSLNGMLIRRSLAPTLPLRSYAPTSNESGVGISYRGSLVVVWLDTSVEYQAPREMLTLGATKDVIAYLTPEGECWIWYDDKEHVQVPLPFKPLALCGGVGGSLCFLLPSGQLQQWTRKKDNSYTPGCIHYVTKGREWKLREHLIENVFHW